MAKSEKIMVIVICCILMTVASSFAQQGYPNKPIQIIVPYAAGGSLDLICRILAEKFREYLGQPVLVVNKPGANGAIGAAFVATSKPDGYNLYAAAGGSLGYFHLMNPNFVQTLNDFSAVASFAKYPIVVAANKNLPVKTLPELISYAKKNPSALTYGTTGYGATGHFCIELLKSTVNIPTGDIPLVPYPGVAPAITGLLGNQVQFATMPLSALVTKHIESGEIRPLVVLSSKRSPFRPEILTVVEQGFPDLDMVDYLSFWLPAKTPASIVKKLEEATRKATEDKEAREKIENMYHEIEVLNPQDLRKLFDDRVSKVEPLIKRLNITAK